MSDIVEKVARDMCIANYGDPDEDMPNDGPRWMYWVPNACAAIKAVAEWQMTRDGEQWQAGSILLAQLKEAANEQ
jgi:hypothetical protein